MNHLAHVPQNPREWKFGIGVLDVYIKPFCVIFLIPQAACSKKPHLVSIKFMSLRVRLIDPIPGIHAMVTRNPS